MSSGSYDALRQDDIYRIRLETKKIFVEDWTREELLILATDAVKAGMCYVYLKAREWSCLDYNNNSITMFQSWSYGVNFKQGLNMHRLILTRHGAQEFPVTSNTKIYWLDDTWGLIQYKDVILPE